MRTSSKQAAKQPAKPPAKARAKVKAASPQPFLRFYHSASLRAKTLAVLTRLEKAKDPTEYRDDLSGIVVELTDSGMEYFFLRPLKVAKVGFFVEQSANLGMSATTGVLASVMRNIIGGMDSPQLLAVCSYIRQLME